jgi:hypothetical protein
VTETPPFAAASSTPGRRNCIAEALDMLLAAKVAYGNLKIPARERLLGSHNSTVPFPFLVSVPKARS